jgi:hypothetical protein
MSGDVIGELRRAIDAVAALDPSELVTADGMAELLEELERAMRRLDFQFHRILRAFEARGDHVPLGYATAAQFARHRIGLSGRRASAAVKLSRDLAFVPDTSARWAAGDVDAERTRIVLSARTDRTRVAFDESEGWLAEQAAVLDLRGLRIVVKRWKLKADPDSDEPERREAERDAHVSKTFQDTVVVDATLGPLGGEVFRTVFDDLVEELFRADWADARRRLGREPSVLDLARTPAQRRADALVLMAERAHAGDPSSVVRSRPLLVVVAGLEALADGLAELWDRTPLTARQLAEVLRQDPDVERYVYGRDEVPIAYNERHRLYTGKLRRAIQVRDRHCTGLGCDRDARFCDVDHIEPIAAGGRTRPGNARVACGQDNRARPRRRFAGDPDPP